jgi:tetratricopeptide (TPR) repeat protein
LTTAIIVLIALTLGLAYTIVAAYTLKAVSARLKRYPAESLDDHYRRLVRISAMVPPLPILVVLKQKASLRAALVAIQLCQPKEAQRLVSPLTRSSSNSVQERAAHDVMALALIAQNQYQAGLQHAQRALAIPGGGTEFDPTPNILIAGVHIRMAQFQEAEQLLRAIENKTPSSMLMVLTCRSLIAMLYGDNQSALDLLDRTRDPPPPKAFASNPQFQYVCASHRANLLNALNRPAEAMEALKPFLTRTDASPRNLILLHATQAESFARLQQPVAAREALGVAEAGLGAFVDHLEFQTEVLSRLASAASTLSDHPLAIAYYQRAIACCVGPADLARMYWHLAQCHIAAGSQEHALQAFAAGANTSVPTRYCEGCQAALGDETKTTL